MLRVVHVAARVGGVINGIQQHILCLAEAQKESGFSPMVLAYEEGHFVDVCRSRDIPVVVEEKLRPLGGRRFPNETSIGLLTEFFTGAGTELIHCHSEAVGAQVMPAGKKLGIPCVFSHHFGAPMTSLTAATEYMGLRFKVIATSRAGLRYLEKDGFPAADLHYVVCGIPPAADARPPEPVRNPDLVMVANLIHRKGVDVAILAMYELHRRYGRDCPSLHIYGDGLAREYLTEMADVLGLSDVITFHGVCPDIMDTHPASDILILPSRSESSPLVVMEAMRRGMPMVASDVGDVADMIPDSRYGRVIPVESVSALVDAIESLRLDISDGRFDPNLLMARQRELYTSEIMAGKIAEVYRQARCA
jgi:glycosyltransferase involved in cell wall biosynthesis